NEVCELIKKMFAEPSNEDKLPLINNIVSQLSCILSQLDMISCLNRLDENLNSVNKKVDVLITISKPRIKEEIVISTGFKLAGCGVQHSIIIPLQAISYTELQEDLERIQGQTIDKLCKLPERLAKQIRGYLLLNNENDILKKLI